MLEPLFIKQLLEAKSVLIAGAGGGFDVFCGLPLFFALKERGIPVNLASLSFSFRHQEMTGRKLGTNIVQVTAQSRGNEYYFPEGYLTQWLGRKNIPQSIFCIRPTGVRGVMDSYTRLLEELKFDTLVLVDGGIDSIMRGDESRIGTPLEDMCSIVAADRLSVPSKQLVCLGYTAETDVCHASALETMALLIRSGAYMGSLSLSLDAPEVKMFVEACDFVFHEMRGYESVICSSVMAALEGQFGDHHRTRRTVGSKLCINPLMPFYWAFDLEKVARSILYLDEIVETERPIDVGIKIKEFREGTPRRRVPHSPFEYEEPAEVVPTANA